MKERERRWWKGMVVVAAAGPRWWKAAKEARAFELGDALFHTSSRSNRFTLSSLPLRRSEGEENRNKGWCCSVTLTCDSSNFFNVILKKNLSAAQIVYAEETNVSLQGFAVASGSPEGFSLRNEGSGKIIKAIQSDPFLLQNSSVAPAGFSDFISFLFLEHTMNKLHF